MRVAALPKPERSIWYDPEGFTSTVRLYLARTIGFPGGGGVACAERDTSSFVLARVGFCGSRAGGFCSEGFDSAGFAASGSVVVPDADAGT